ncbi:hypothetical protein HYC85_006540 [Camellia sinensis]|uniref:Uncharacterized protein n=1 Tax=Camellia sinensis TaxID=4442 RepID=A0A7J7HNX4_CAMSI|nr:hypothetical protein HYC85_006540 [Camellia sinensis]
MYHLILHMGQLDISLSPLLAFDKSTLACLWFCLVTHPNIPSSLASARIHFFIKNCDMPILR